jgi:UDP-N-acetylmuramoylalanine--D-glutamate ligase
LVDQFIGCDDRRSFIGGVIAMTDWKKRRVLVIGAARQGMALARHLAQHGAQVVVNDRREAIELQEARRELADLPLTWVMGSHPVELLDGTDLVCPSAGVPLTLPIILEARQRGIPFSNDSQIFLESAPCKIVGITGSAGKTTTTTLVGRMANAAVNLQPSIFNHVWVGGNIGNPLLSDLAEMKPDDLVVMELSSFQLELMTRSPQVAAVLNITPNHLDRHSTMEAYLAAKMRILDFQTGTDTAILGRDDPGAWGLADSVRGGLLSFGFLRPPSGQSGTSLRDGWITLWERDSHQDLLSRADVQLRGEHNLHNVLAACAIAAAVGLPKEAMQAGVDGFTGVPHRLEFVRSWGGADWYNDSIATAPERTIADIRSFDQPLVLLAGGRDKDLPWEDLAALIHQRVDHLVLFGEAAGMIARFVGKITPGSRLVSIDICDGPEQSVKAAAEVVEQGDVVLFSPGGTSFDEFRDFADRGEWFKKWVNMLP